MKKLTFSLILKITLSFIIIIISVFFARFLFYKLQLSSFLHILAFFSIASVVIFPSPLDLIYIDLLRQGIPFVFIGSFFGILIGQNINYFFGRYFSHLINPLIKTNTRKWITDKLFRYEGYAIFFINLFPFPYTILNFLVGITRFNYYSWFLLTAFALFLKLTVINFFYSFF